ncbi:hypothetical protein [Flavobacterium rhizosphaerae]|uniref:DUF4468 domain-containing protein n=1 Tax=Flavobacterium rhizosphaerae TaxID=3163298 RepID=A0ABW8YZ84_9FLAO
MKKVLFILLLIVTWSFEAQVNNFVMHKNKMIWENVFLTEGSDIPNLIIRHPQLSITSVNGKKYNGTCKDVNYVCENTSEYMSQKMSFDFQIEIQKGKYRVTIFNLQFSKQGLPAAKAKAEDYFVEKGNLKTQDKTVRDMDCMDAYFNKIFTMTAVYKNKL